MARDQVPTTPAVRVLRQQRVDFVAREYRYAEGAIAEHAAEELGVLPARMVKTLVLEDERRRPLLVLMRGDRQVSLKGLARILGVKAVALCDEATAHRHTGYVRGGTSPFGTLKPLPAYVEASLLEHPRLVVNGGRRGLMLELATADLLRVLHPTPVSVAVE